MKRLDVNKILTKIYYTSKTSFLAYREEQRRSELKSFQSVNQLKYLYVGQISMQINVPNYLEKAQKKEMKKRKKKERKEKLHPVISLVGVACIFSRRKKGSSYKDGFHKDAC